MAAQIVVKLMPCKNLILFLDKVGLMKKVIYLILISYFNLNCLIIESCKFETIKKYILPKQTLVAIDLDNTLIEPDNEIGSHQWLHALKHYEINRNINSDLNCIKNKIEYAFFQAQKDLHIKLVDSNALNIIRYLQKKTIPVIGFTHRSIELLQLTKKQLKPLNIDFSKTSPTSQDLILDLVNDTAMFNAGILFSNINPKGPTLKVFLKRINYYPKLIVMIDDQLKNLISIQQACDELGIEFIGIRYSYLDEKVKNFKLIPEMIPSFC